jgi:hypothetical protein
MKKRAMFVSVSMIINYNNNFSYYVIQDTDCHHSFVHAALPFSHPLHSPKFRDCLGKS